MLSKFWNPLEGGPLDSMKPARGEEGNNPCISTEPYFDSFSQNLWCSVYNILKIDKTTGLDFYISFYLSPNSIAKFGGKLKDRIKNWLDTMWGD